MYHPIMRYLVKAHLKPGRERALLNAIQTGELGRGSIAGDEYISDMHQARVDEAGLAQWVETCFCTIPLDEERPYWEQFLNLISIKDAHARRNCKHENGTESWNCCNCDCTAKLEKKLEQSGKLFLDVLKSYNS
jgi:hypothetical protein